MAELKYMSDIKCNLCGNDIQKAASNGNHLKRVSPQGKAMIMECYPSCQYTGTPTDALINALAGDDDERA